MPDFFTRQQQFTASAFNKYSSAAAKSAIDRKFRSQLDKKAKVKMLGAADSNLAKAKQDAARAFNEITKVLGDGVDRAYNVIYHAFILDVFESWPVRTGFSKSQFDLLYSTKGQVLSAQFVNYARYSRMIQEPLPANQKTMKQRQRRWAMAKRGNAKRVIGNGVNIMRKRIFLPSAQVATEMADAIAASAGGFRG